MDKKDTDKSKNNKNKIRVNKSKVKKLKSYRFPRNIVKWAKVNLENLKQGVTDPRHSDKSIPILVSPCGKFLLKEPDSIIDKKPKYAIPTKGFKVGKWRGVFLQPMAKLNLCEKITEKTEKLMKRRGFRDVYGGDFHSGNVGKWKNMVVVIDW